MDVWPKSFGYVKTEPEVHYTLRTARQLVDVVEHQHADLTTSLEQATLDAETRERLEALGSR